MLSIGFASRCITPPLGAEMPGLFERRMAAGIADDLYARAAVIRDGRGAVVIVQVDAIAVPEGLVATVRARIGRKLGVPRDRIMVAATHTHSGGPVADLFASSADPRYLSDLARLIAEAVIEADSERRTCCVGSSIAHAPGVAFNRRFVMRDGSHVTHPGKMNPNIVEPAGPADDSVLVLGFRDAKTYRPLGSIVTFACHPTHMNGVLYSADYPRWVVESLRSVYGPEFGVVFLNAPCADVTQIDNLNPRPLEFGPYWCERTGRAVGAAALQALATADYFTAASIDAETKRIPARIRSSSAAELEAARKRLARARKFAADSESLYACEILAVDALRTQKKSVNVEIQAVRVADTLLWTVPGELFQSFALEVRNRSPFSRTSGVTLANGYYGYICTREAYLKGGYEVRLARSSMLDEFTGERAANVAAELAQALHRRAARELQRLPGKRTWPASDDSALDGIRSLREN